MILETERLRLREYLPSDFERVHIYGADPEFSQFDVWGPNDEKDTHNFIADAIDKSKKANRYEYELAVVLKDGDLLIGGCGIRRDWEFSRIANMGYAINPQFQGKGFATEASLALIKFGFEVLSLAVVYATCDTRNTASFKVMEKLGMSRVGEVKNHKLVKGVMRDSYCYELVNPKLSGP